MRNTVVAVCLVTLMACSKPMPPPRTSAETVEQKTERMRKTCSDLASKLYTSGQWTTREEMTAMIRASANFQREVGDAAMSKLLDEYFGQGDPERELEYRERSGHKDIEKVPSAYFRTWISSDIAGYIAKGDKTGRVTDTEFHDPLAPGNRAGEAGIAIKEQKGEPRYKGRVMAEWERDLCDRDPETRARAGQALASIGTDAIPFLAEAMRDQNLDVQLAAIGVLSRISESGTSGASISSSVSALAAGLRDRNPDIRKAATVALMGLGARGLLPLIPYLGDKNEEIRTMIAQALKTLGPESRDAAGSLIQLLDYDGGELRNIDTYKGMDLATWVQNEAAQALLRIGPGAMPAIEKALSDAKGLRRQNLEWVTTRLKGK